MTYIPYEPPERMFSDTLLAFKDFQDASAGVAVQVDPDPLGPVNRIVSIVHTRGGETRRIKSKLMRLPVGSVVRLTRGYVNPRFVGESEQYGRRVFTHRMDCGWCVEVDGETVLTATDNEIWPAPPVPPVPLWQRMRRALTDQLRADADAIAKRLGYHRDDECEDY